MNYTYTMNIDLYQELQQQLLERKHKVRIFSEDYLTMDYDVLNKWLYANWIGYQTERTIREGSMKMLELIKEMEFSQIINDNTNMLGIWTPAALWVGAIWFPEMIVAGLKQFAWIYSPGRMSQVSADAAISKTPQPEIIRIFNTVDEGKDWLRKVTLQNG